MGVTNETGSVYLSGSSDLVHNWLEKFEDTKVVIISCNSKKDRQYNGQKNKRLKFKKCSTNYLQYEPY
jgi:hypothetical protein